MAEIEHAFYSQYKTKSFHLDKYCFDSKSEMALFGNMLKDGRLQKVYYTGMFRHGQSEFIIYYIDPHSHALRSYYPDFLAQEQSGHYIIFEVKGDNRIEDPIVKAKAEYARQMATGSGMSYLIVRSSEAESKGSIKNNLVSF